MSNRRGRPQRANCGRFGQSGSPSGASRDRRVRHNAKVSDEPGPIDRAVTAAVHRALLPYGPDAATVERVWGAAAGMWFTEVRPAGQAASIDLAFDGVDDLFVTVGRTSFEVFPFGIDDLEYLDGILEGIFAGRVEEAGFRANSLAGRVGLGSFGFARIYTRGDVVSVGSLHLPIPWRLWPMTRYQTYGDRTDPQP